MCNPSDKASRHSQALSEQQFQWQKDQAAQAAKDAAAKRAAMGKGLIQIGKKFNQFNDKYYDGVADGFRSLANPQIEKSQSAASYGLASALANHGKLGSSTDAKQTADLSTTYTGIYRDAELKAQDYANQQRQTINGAKQASISQMYAAENASAGLQAASGAVQAFNRGPSYEPITGILAQASKFANLDYNNSVLNGRSNGLFSPLFAGQAAQQQPQNSPTGGSTVKTIY